MFTNIGLWTLVYCVLAALLFVGCGKSSAHPDPPIAMPDKIEYVKSTDKIASTIDDQDVIKKIVAEVNAARLRTVNVPKAMRLGRITLQYNNGRESVSITLFASQMIAIEKKGDRDYYDVEKGGWFDEQGKKIQEESVRQDNQKDQ
jgi:hypothetical protein